MNHSHPYSTRAVIDAAWKMARFISRCDAAELVRYRRIFTARTTESYCMAWDRYEFLIVRRAHARENLANMLCRLEQSGMGSESDNIIASLPAWSKASRTLTLENPGKFAGSDGYQFVCHSDAYYASLEDTRNI